MELTYQQKGFSQSMFGGSNQTEAYKANYDASNMSIESIYVEASRLMANPKVALRIQELRQAVTDSLVAKTVWSKEKLISKAEVSYDGAIDSKQYSAANGALKLIGETAGLLDSGLQAPVTITKVTVVLSPGTKILEASGSTMPEIEGE